MTAESPRPEVLHGALRAGLLLTRCWCVALAVAFGAGLVVCAYRGDDVVPVWLAAGDWGAGDVATTVAEAGWSQRFLTAALLTVEAATAGVGLAAAFIVLRGADSWFRAYVAAALALFGTMSGVVPAALDLATNQGDLFGPLQGLAWVALFPLAYLLPDGHFVPSWSRWFAVAWGGYLLMSLLAPPVARDVLGIAEPVLLLVLFGSAAGVATYRYRRVSSPEQRRQTRWVMAAFALRFAFMVGVAIALIGLARDGDDAPLSALLAIAIVSYVLGALIPAAIALAVVRYRLFGVDVWLNRTLVYLLLTTFVVAGYAAVVASVGVFWPGDGRILPLIAAVAVALAASPVRTWLERGVNRFVYGQRHEPFAVVSALGDRLESAVAPGDVLESIVHTIGPALRLPWVSAVLDNPPDVQATYDAVGRPDPPPPLGPIHDIPLRHEQAVLGRLRVAARPGYDLDQDELAMLDSMARQAGAAVHTAAVTAELARTHQQLLTAVAAERRRMHRDLHDGLGPTMASLFQHIDAARSLVKNRPQSAVPLLDAAADQSRTALADLRRLVHDLHPPDLAELGLSTAIERTCRLLNPRPGDLSIQVHADDLPPLSDAVKVAAYRIVGEAITNVIKHAAATRVVVAIKASEDDALTVRIDDDGVGMPEEPRDGVGIRSMRERAASLGGRLDVTCDAGTSVVAVLPMSLTRSRFGADR